MSHPISQARLRVDTWDPERGASYDEDDNPSKDPPETDVECSTWAPIRPPAPAVPPRCAFVDGVRRVDVGLFAELDGDVAPAIAGAYAVGAAWAPLNPSLEICPTERLLVVGKGREHADLTVGVGLLELYYRYLGSSGERPQNMIQKLQNEMRDAEARLAAEIHRRDKEWVIVDGPLNYGVLPEGVPIVGLVKRQTQVYLREAEHREAQAGLNVGERTPLFRIKGNVERYSWYVRLARGRPIDGTLTGLVRLEVSASIRQDDVVRIADTLTPFLPTVASQAGHDPRSPQNLYPVGQLEMVLRHRLGDAQLVRRGIETALWNLEYA